MVYSVGSPDTGTPAVRKSRLNPPGRAARLFHAMFLRCKAADPAFSLRTLERETGISKTRLHKMMCRQVKPTFDPEDVVRLFGPLSARGIEACEIATLMGDVLSSVSVSVLPDAISPIPVLELSTVLKVARLGEDEMTAGYEDRRAAYALFEACGGIADWQYVGGAPATCWEIEMWDMSFRYALPGQRLVVDYTEREMVEGRLYLLAFGEVLQCGRFEHGHLAPLPHDGHGAGEFAIPLAAARYVVMGRIRKVVSADL